MSTVVSADCAGLWRRTLLISSDGTRDTGTAVTWLQGPTAYVDSRGFAGTLNQHGDVFEWHRAIDLQPPGPFPDAGIMRWDGDILVETGLHEDYVEHWDRRERPTEANGAVFLRGPVGQPALLVRVGETFGWACGSEVIIDTVESPRWAELTAGGHINQIRSNGVRWVVERAEGSVKI